MSEQGKRFNQGKVRLSLVPWTAIRLEALVWEFGAVKYGLFNWQKGMPWSWVIDSMKRHLEAIERGEDIDPETGLPHAGALCCNSSILSHYLVTGTGTDDRRRYNIVLPLEMNQEKYAAAVEKYQKPADAEVPRERPGEKV